MSETPEIRLERAADPGDGAVVLELAGELDLAVSGRLRDLLDGVGTDEADLVVLDVTGVEFMDSTILRELLRTHRRFEDAGARLVVAGARSAVYRLLELTGTDQVFELMPSRQEALESRGDSV